MKRHGATQESDGPFTLTEFVTLDQARELAAELGAEAYAYGLQIRINVLGSIYRYALWHKSASHPKRTRAELDQLSRNIDATLAALDQLNVHSEQRLSAALTNDQFTTVTTCREHMTRLRKAADEARTALRSGAGRADLDELRNLCHGFAFAYENLSGRWFTYDAYRDAGGKHAFLTEGAMWVARMAKIVDPEITDANLRTAMRDLPNSLP